MIHLLILIAGAALVGLLVRVFRDPRRGRGPGVGFRRNPRDDRSHQFAHGDVAHLPADLFHAPVVRCD